MSIWIDTHCHLDAQEFEGEAIAVRLLASSKNVAHCVLPAVQVAHFARVRALAHELGDSYALGIHPLYVAQAQASDLAVLDAQLTLHSADPRLVAVGEMGLDYFVPELAQEPLRERQEHFCREQLLLARAHGLPVILHVRRSADQLLKLLRQLRGASPWQGIAHAFNGSLQQADEFIKLGLKLGFGGALTFERARKLRRLAAQLPLEAIVLETDAPDMPPQWLYQTAGQRQAGQVQARNEPAQLPRIGQVVAELRGMAVEDLAHATTVNALQALPKLQSLVNLMKNQ